MSLYFESVFLSIFACWRPMFCWVFNHNPTTRLKWRQRKRRVQSVQNAECRKHLGLLHASVNLPGDGRAVFGAVLCWFSGSTTSKQEFHLTSKYLGKRPDTVWGVGNQRGRCTWWLHCGALRVGDETIHAQSSSEHQSPSFIRTTACTRFLPWQHASVETTVLPQLLWWQQWHLHSTVAQRDWHYDDARWWPSRRSKHAVCWKFRMNSPASTCPNVIHQ